MNTDKLIIGLYGRGGQGVITAAKIICKTAILENKDLFTMLIPHYGPERTGGPVKALVEIGSVPIKDRSSLKQPTHLMIFDKSLFQTEIEKNVIEGKSACGGLNIFFNATAAEIEYLSQNNNYLNKHKIILLEKSGNENKPANILMLYCFFKETKIASLQNLEKAINEVLKKTINAKGS